MNQPIPTWFHHWLTAYALYSYVSLVMCAPMLLLQMHGVDLVPPFDRPWLSTSLSDFWGRRWVRRWDYWRGLGVGGWGGVGGRASRTVGAVQSS